MSINVEKKSEILLNILKSTGFKDCYQLSPRSFEYVFGIPEVSQFFDWFVENVNENCHLRHDEVNEFKQILAKGHVIMDLERLENIQKLINLNKQREDFVSNGDLRGHNNDDNLETIEDLERENYLNELEIEMLTKKLDKQKFMQRKMNENLKILKHKEDMELNKIAMLKEKLAITKSNIKHMNQTLSKSLIEFQTIFNDEEKINSFFFGDLKDELSFNNYLSTEKTIINYIKVLKDYEYDYSNMMELDMFNCLNDLNELNIQKMELGQNEKDNEYERIKKILKLMVVRYPNLMGDWFSNKLNYELEKSELFELIKIAEKPREFFQCTQEQLRSNPNNRLALEELTKRNQAYMDQLNKECKQLSLQIKSLIKVLSSLKMVDLLNLDINKKQIELNLYINKQEKLMRVLNWQKDRIQFLEYLQDQKLDEIDNLKTLFDELITENNMFSSNNNQNSMIISASPNIKKNMNLFSSTANIFSSTMIAPMNATSGQASFFLSSPNRLNQYKKSAISSFSLTSNKFSSNPYTDYQFTSNKAQSNSKHIMNEFDSPFMHILNQFFISSLTEFESEDFDQRLFKFKHPISIDFNENLDNFIHIFNNVHGTCLSSGSSKIAEHLKEFYRLIKSGINYLYEKDNNQNSRSNMTCTFNLSKIQLTRTKSLEDSLKKLNDVQSEIHDAFAMRIFQKFNNYKTQLASNKLVQLKRNLFIHFYTNSQQLEHLIEQLNSVSFFNS
jgi:hypothetical protein